MMAAVAAHFSRLRFGARSNENLKLERTVILDPSDSAAADVTLAEKPNLQHLS
jgi:hypothetical protein